MDPHVRFQFAKPKNFFLFLVFCVSTATAQTTSWFRPMTTDIGFSTTTKGLRLSSCDINNDLYPDFIYIRDHSTPNDIHVFLNQDDPNSSDPADRIFEDISAYSGVNVDPLDTSDTRKADHFVLGDFNNDGNVDIATGVWWYSPTAPHATDRCEVLLGDGTGKFSLVKNNGLSALGKINSTGMSLLDYNLDGKLDIYIYTWFTADRSGYEQDYLMEGNGDGTFRDVSVNAGIAGIKFPMHGATAVDWNNDGWPDVITAPYCRSGGSVLKNNGNGTFTDVAASIGYSAQHSPGDAGKPACQWGAYTYDYDNDGDFDVLQTIVHGGIDGNEARSNINTNSGPPHYFLQHDYTSLHRKSPQSTHLGNMDAAWFDFDNNGRVDLAVTEAEYQDATDRAYFYLQDENGTFQDVTAQLGLDVLIRSPHSCEVFDFDLDGDYDYITNHLRAKSKGKTHLLFFENEIGQDKNWIGIRLNPPSGANKKAIGAKIKVITNGTTQTIEVQAGRGHFSGQQPFETLFGIDTVQFIDTIKVDWPMHPKRTEVFTNIKANQYISIDSSILTGINNLPINALTQGIHIYPNPASNHISIGTLNFKPDQLLVRTLQGKVLMEVPFSPVLRIDHLPNGVYLIQVIGNKQQFTQRMVVMH
jgi:hypothetical protein